MKRIETIEDVRDAMQMNPYFYGYVMYTNDDDRDYFHSKHKGETRYIFTECRSLLVDALNESMTLEKLHLHIKDICKKMEDALDDEWLPSVDETIENMLNNGGYLENIIIDDGKVYRLYECYAEHDDKTFIMREEFYPSIDEWDFDRDGDWEMPNQELMGWYCGSPTEESTDEFYGKC